MITEDYVSFEVAKLLKEKGYCNISNTLYKGDGKFIHYDVGLNNKGFSTTLETFYEAPTHQMALKWLREIYNIDVQVFRHIRGNKITFYGRIEQNTHLEHLDKCNLYKSYEEAVEAAIKYCLTNLIK